MRPEEISFLVRGLPRAQGSCRAYVCQGRAIVTNKNPNLNMWRELVRVEGRAHAPVTLWEGALNVSCYFTFSPTKARKKQGMSHYQRPDIDKLLRAVLDALTGVIWRDDAQVMILRGQKSYLDPPGCRITILRCGSDTG